MVFPYSQASTCLDSSGILKEEAEQEGFAWPLSSPWAACAPCRGLHALGRYYGEVIYCFTATVHLKSTTCHLIKNPIKI